MAIESARAARVVALSLQAVTVVGAVAGVQGFLSGAFDPLVAQLEAAWPLLDGPVLPAVALAGVVALPQALALVAGLRPHGRAADVGLLAGVALTGWVVVQLPLIGWTSPVQWAFVAIGVGEVAASTVWRSRVRRRAADERLVRV